MGEKWKIVDKMRKKEKIVDKMGKKEKSVIKMWEKMGESEDEMGLGEIGIN